MIPIAYWKNTFVRRTTLVLTFPFIVIIALVYVSLVACYDELKDVGKAFITAWNGKKRYKGSK
jgi:hypothetical protein